FRLCPCSRLYHKVNLHVCERNPVSEPLFQKYKWKRPTAGNRLPHFLCTSHCADSNRFCAEIRIGRRSSFRKSGRSAQICGLLASNLCSAAFYGNHLWGTDE